MEGLRRYLLDRSIFLIIGEATGVIQNSAVKTSRLLGQARVSLLFKLSNPHGSTVVQCDQEKRAPVCPRWIERGRLFSVIEASCP